MVKIASHRFRRGASGLGPAVLAVLAALVAGCSSSSSEGDVTDEAATVQPGPEGIDVAGTYSLTFITEAGGTTLDTYRIAQDGSEIRMTADCNQVSVAVDCLSLDGALGSIASAGDGVRFPCAMANEQVVISGTFIREAQFILFEAQVTGAGPRSTGRLAGIQPRPVPVPVPSQQG